MLPLAYTHAVPAAWRIPRWSFIGPLIGPLIGSLHWQPKARLVRFLYIPVILHTLFTLSEYFLFSFENFYLFI